MSQAVAAVSTPASAPASRLRGRTLLILDASAPHSHACSLHLLRQGASLLLFGPRAHALLQQRAELLDAVPGARVECCVGDAREPAQLRQAMLHACGMQRRLDLLVFEGKGRTRGGRIMPLCPRMG